MLVQVFDLLYTDPDQVREFLLAMAKEGFVGGVYLWINRLNGKTYVGSSVNMYSRIKGYLSLNKLHGIIGKGLRKYGTNGFVILIILFPNATRPSVLALEQSILDSRVCAYNILPTAGSSAGVKHSEETKGKMSAAQKGKNRSEETKEKISASRKGKTHSDETKTKISASKQGHKHSEETKAKLSAAGFNRGQPVYLYLVQALGLELSASYLNRIRASEHLRISKTTVSNYIKNRTLFEVNGKAHMVSHDGNLS